MTKGIEDMLNLPNLDEILKEDGVDWEETSHEDEDDDEFAETPPVEKAHLDILTSLQEKISTVEGADHAKAMDELFKETREQAQTIYDLAFNVDDKARRGLLEQAANFYKVALDAKNSKRTAQLNAWKLLQAQQKLNMDERKFKRDTGEAIDSVDTTATVLADRNDLVKQIRAEMAQDWELQTRALEAEQVARVKEQDEEAARKRREEDGD